MLAGAAAGVLPDADIFIRSETDPMLAIEFHRHFTHSFFMQPLLALSVTVLLWAILRPFARLRVPVGALYPAALVGGLTHVICDAWTSYGTRIWWPFSDARVAWDLTSVIDPLFTLPVLLLTVIGLALGGKRARLRWLPWGWVALYLMLAVVQQQRARSAVEDWLACENRDPTRITVKPSFGNIIVWRAILDEGDRFQALALRPGLRGVGLIVGEQAARLEHDPRFPGLPNGSIQASDLERFRHFSDNWLGLVIGDYGQLVVADMRYAMAPQRMSPLWGIGIDPGQADTHVDWVTFRELRSSGWGKLVGLIRGRGFVRDSAGDDSSTR